MNIRKSLLTLILVCITLAIAAQTPTLKPGTPAHAVKTFYTAMAKTDFTTAKKYLVSKELTGMIKFLEDMSKQVSIKEDAKNDFGPMAAAKFLSEKITGNKAEVTFTYKVKGKKNKKETHKLQKSNGIWKIVD